MLMPGRQYSYQYETSPRKIKPDYSKPKRNAPQYNKPKTKAKPKAKPKVKQGSTERSHPQRLREQICSPSP